MAKEEKDIKTMNLFEKMLCITNELGFVNKNLQVGVSKTSSYKAVSELDVIEAVKPLETKYRVFSYPVNREEINNEILTSESEYNGKTTIKNNLFLRVKTTYRFVNVDNIDETLDIVSYGDGIDSGDKGCGKAMTYADKYALMKAYKISTGDDPDKEASKEYGKTTKTKAPVETDPSKIKATNQEITELSKIYQSTGNDWFLATIASYNLSMEQLSKGEVSQKQVNDVKKDYKKYVDNKKSNFGA